MNHQNLVDAGLIDQSYCIPLSKAFDVLKKDVIPQLKVELAQNKVLYPEEANILRVFKDTPYQDIRVVVWGQDPYHDGSAMGIAFDNVKSRKPSPSLRNLIKEIAEDTGKMSLAATNAVSYLEHLPKQGVLLLNRALTVEEGKPMSHAKVWEKFTDEVLLALNSKPFVVHLLMGGHARALAPNINQNHAIVETAHPSPFSYKLFKGSKPFTKINSILREKGLAQIVF